MQVPGTNINPVGYNPAILQKNASDVQLGNAAAILAGMKTRHQDPLGMERGARAILAILDPGSKENV